MAAMGRAIFFMSGSLLVLNVPRRIAAQAEAGLNRQPLS